MKQDKSIDKYIKEGLKVEKTSLGFSNNVMQQIHTLNIEKEKALTSLMQKYILQEPSLNFTANTLSKINSDLKSATYQPVISKKAWFTIASILISVSIYIIVYMDSVSLQSDLLLKNIQKLESLFSFELPSLLTSPLFALSIFALSSLLFLDYFLRKRRISS